MNRTLTTLMGPVYKQDGGIAFSRIPRASWTHWMMPDPNNRVDLESRSLLVQEGDGRNVLVMAGGEALLAPSSEGCRRQVHGWSKLLSGLAEKGLDESDIHVVVLAHLRVNRLDEWTWMEHGSLRLLFPRAVYVTSKRHWCRARTPHPADKASFAPQLVTQLERSGRLELIDDGMRNSLGDGWRFHFSDGYTPGQIITEVEMPGGSVLFGSDLIPGRNWLQLLATTGDDRNPEQLIEEKESLLDYAVENRCRLIFVRDPEVACARVMRNRQSHYVPFDQKERLRSIDG